MGDSKRIRKLSLSFIRDTIVRKTRGFNNESTCTSSTSYYPGQESSSTGSTHLKQEEIKDPGTLETAALDLALTRTSQTQTSSSDGNINNL
jgi:hypothetical protein